MPDTRQPGRVIAVGASAGGIEALRVLLGTLPAGLDAAVCVVLHIPATAPSVLAPILDRHSALPVSTAADGEPLLAGHVYVAPPDRHLLIRDGHLELGRGPKENGVRPAVDATFRSLARAYGPAGIGVVLSGALDDGSTGSAVLHRAGGTILVQDPEDALVSSMPESAIRADAPWRILPVDRLAAALAELTGTAVPEEHSAPPDDTVDAALWTTLEVLEERVAFLQTLAARAERLGAGFPADRFETAAREAERRAAALRDVLVAPRADLKLSPTAP